MQGELTQNEIDELLYAENIGHLGGYITGRSYILPINYAYDGEYIYGCSLDGVKIQMLRTNPEICFQVEQILDGANWKSVLVWGTYQELHGEEAAQALQLITRYLTMQIASGNALHEIKAKRPDNTQPKIIIYRIHINEMSGRFEKQDREIFFHLTVERYPLP
jgi:Predicted flavin-nucleotide-binding protein